LVSVDGGDQLGGFAVILVGVSGALVAGSQVQGDTLREFLLLTPT